MMVSAVFYVIIPVLLACIRKYRVYAWGKCKDVSSLQGKVFLVTGANSGIGKETVRELIRRKARVIMACRDMNKAKEAIEDIRRDEIYGELIPMHLDLASMKSIRAFSDEIKRLFPKVHVLINNAGVYFPTTEKRKTEDGFEIHFGVNHLGHFLLAELLLSKLQSSAPSRVVNVASTLYEKSIASFDTTAIPPGYQHSKLANILFTMELAKRTETTGIKVYAVCPGFTYTGLFRSRPLRWYHYLLIAPVAFFYMRTANQGAQTVVYCAISQEVSNETGLIYRDCQHYKSKKDINPELASKLWEVSEDLVGLTSS